VEQNNNKKTGSKKKKKKRNPSRAATETEAAAAKADASAEQGETQVAVDLDGPSRQHESAAAETEGDDAPGTAASDDEDPDAEQPGEPAAQSPSVKPISRSPSPRPSGSSARRDRRGGTSSSSSSGGSTLKKKPDPRDLFMVVNDVPGEECRIALIDAKTGLLEELYSERVAFGTNVNNIYKGRVMNVEPAIQAAFVDFGQAQNGFLHISDLHPRYFPKGDKTERVGKKIPRRDRPPIQDALRRGDDILVQVIKEGIGTKGPTLTSYLSIPGRLMVMMPGMDRVGVSRKIEDEEERREMRQILDGLDLPDGLGFILRTAGFGRTKTELKRDLAFLKRLWSQMEKRIKGTAAPCPLYVESDLLIRTIRDVLTNEISAIIVDSGSAFKRATDFLGVIAPRSAPKLIRYRRNTPIFHAFDVERQIDLIHQREVPLPSGGALVIEQTEALVAIDVNSGKSRSARDSETNAFRTNLEAADEICRQLRLRDLGGLVVCDLIDMIRGDNRRRIEERFEENLDRDRARAQITRISEFGILEMTRQRMRPSMRKTHYQPCPHCEGRGEVRTPESIAADALRHAAYLLHYDRIDAVEIACAARVAGSFLSSKRRELVRIEDAFDKKIRIRVSDTIPLGRVDYYAYDDRSADVDVTRLPSITPPRIGDLEKEAEAHLREREKQGAGPEPGAAEGGPAAGGKKKRKRRRKSVASLESTLTTSDFEQELRKIEAEEQREAEAVSGGAAATESLPSPKKKRRRRRRRRGGGGSPEQAATAPGTGEPAAAERDDEAAAPSASPESAAMQAPPKKKSRRRRRKKSSAAADSAAAGTQNGAPGQSVAPASEGKPPSVTDSADAEALPDVASSSSSTKKTKRRRSRKKKAANAATSAPAASVSSPASEPPSTPAESKGKESPAPAAKPRSLYRSRRKLTPEETRAAQDRDR